MDAGERIAALEWRLAAAEAREAEWRTRVARLIAACPQFDASGKRLANPVSQFIVPPGAVNSLARLLEEPQDDRRLIYWMRTALHALTHSPPN